ncbi:hypothetical protein VN97_g10584 [Penicillium thymicola]|uniref:Uncharacterized protein n=1 Tax=Penicillium thymicola TaxID=293382 RepID=A0AAI9T8P6_PENTH|nr:hypothetical protein VN97_g10584 [Penicillium thymicola]
MLEAKEAGSTSYPCLWPDQTLHEKYHWARGREMDLNGLDGPLTEIRTMVIGLNRASFLTFLTFTMRIQSPRR